MSTARTTHAVILGGGLAGMLAAAAVAGELDQVTVLDRDLLPDGPHTRRGVPQGHHSHMLMSHGARLMDDLLPGVLDDLLTAGAHRIEVPAGLLSHTAQGWARRSAELQFIVTCGRPLLDWTVRNATLARGGVTLRQNVQVDGLVGDRDRVRGVQVRDRWTGATSVVEADLVVDASGRGSQSATWLTGLGLPRVRRQTIETGLVYATQLFHAPAGAERGFPIVNVLADPGDVEPGRAGAILPIEDGRWIVTLSGTRGTEPPKDREGFVAFARGLRHPVIGDLIAGAEPIGPIHGSRATANRRHYYEKLSSWPAGFVVLGDALAAFNPVYGHGMTVAAREADVLRAALRRHGLTDPVARATQRQLANAVRDPWALATGQDKFFPTATGASPSLVDRLLRRYTNRVHRAAASRPKVTAALSDAFTLSAPLSRLTSPSILLETLRSAPVEPLTGPPFTDEERAVLHWLDPAQGG